MPNEYTDWLVMVYISADGLLANFAVESLKQLKRAAGNGVKVVAQFDTDGIIPPRLYDFDGSDGGANDKGDGTSSLAVGKPPDKLPEKLKITDPKNLTEFIDNAVLKHPRAKHHALFLWGHGPELLADEGPRSETEAAEDRKNPGKRIEKKYLTASQLRGALSKTKLATKKPEEKPKKVDILGLDACSMSMVELASELGDYVEFMVASQDDVPDQSFPYEDILRRLKEPANANDPSKASTMIPELYREAYRDYITDPRTGFRAFTLSVVDLGEDKMKVLRAELKKLAGALLQLSSDPTRRHQIVKARKSTQGFVFGLFVDIVDLCDKLDDSKIYDKDLTDACAQVRQAVKAAVIENQVLRSDPVYSADKETPVGVKVEAVNGLSIYFPYRIPDETEQLQELRKGSGPLPAKGSGALPAKERSLRIKELEQDLTKLRIFQETGWNDFIREGWSSILASEVPTELDEVYSGQRCAQNLGSLQHHGRGMGRAA